MLRPDTEKLWKHLERSKALRGFVLAGGTALSLHLQHRLSEDLDFMFIGQKLPLVQIQALKKSCHQAGFSFVVNDSPSDIREWEDSGLELADYQHNYIVGGTVKVSLWAPDQDVLRLMASGLATGVRVATLRELFDTKCLVCADRSKTRDWFDLFTMLQRGLFEPMDIYGAFVKAGVLSKFDIARSRMTYGKPSLDDEGYASLLENPPGAAEMQDYFSGVFSKIEVEVSRLALKTTLQKVRTDRIQRP